MNSSTIGVQTITPTTGTAAQNSNPAPDRPATDENVSANSSPPRVNPASSTAPGSLVDKTV